MNAKIIKISNVINYIAIIITVCAIVKQLYLGDYNGAMTSALILSYLILIKFFENSIREKDKVIKVQDSVIEYYKSDGL